MVVVVVVVTVVVLVRGAVTVTVMLTLGSSPTNAAGDSRAGSGCSPTNATGSSRTASSSSLPTPQAPPAWPQAPPPPRRHLPPHPVPEEQQVGSIGGCGRLCKNSLGCFCRGSRSMSTSCCHVDKSKLWLELLEPQGYRRVHCSDSRKSYRAMQARTLQCCASCHRAVRGNVGSLRTLEACEQHAKRASGLEFVQHMADS